MGGSIGHSPVLEDIDNDGELEIISIGNYYEVYAWNFDGSNVPNWPVDLSPYVSGSPCAIVVGDVNRDGFKEVVVTSMSRIFVLSNEGEVLYNWQPDGDPYSVSANYPVLADINNDDSLEILLTSYNEVFAWRYNGQEIWKKVYEGEAGQIAIGNIECNSSSPEIIVCSRHKIYGYHGDGTSLSGNWPVSIENVSWVWSSGVHSGSVIGDIDGDNELEVILNGLRTSDGHWVIYALNPDGSVVEGYPIVEGGYNNIRFSNTPVLADIDKDGDIELCSYAQTHPHGPEEMIVVVYDLPFPYNPQKIEWPMLRHDCRRTGVYPEYKLEIEIPTGLYFSDVPVTISNIGPESPTDVYWTFSMDPIIGRVLIGGHQEGSIAEILPGGQQVIIVGPVFGFGLITINVTVSAINAYEISTSKTGFIFGPFVFVIK